MSLEQTPQIPNEAPAIHEPAPRQRSRWRTLLLPTAIGLIIAAIAFFSLHWFTHPATSAPNLFGNHTTGNTSGGGSAPTQDCTKFPADISAIVRQQVAQGLHLAPDELASQLQSGASMADVANHQHFTSDQLHTIEINAYRTAFTQQVSSNKMSQQDADQVIAALSQGNPTLLDRTTRADCLHPENDRGQHIWCVGMPAQQ